MKKIVSAFICALLVCTLLFTGLFCIGEVQAASKPSVPQFSVKFIDSSYDVPSSSTTDQYTGVTTTYPSYRVNQMSIEVTIKNQQPFTPYTNAHGEEVNLYYTVLVKGHFGEDWTSFGSRSSTAQSNSGHTVITSVSAYEAGSKLDFKVQAGIGFMPTFVDGMMGYWGAIGVFGLQAETQSEWSKTQTVTVPKNSNETPNQTESPPMPSSSYISEQTDSQTDTVIAGFSLLEFSLMIILCTILPVLIIALIYTSKAARHKQDAQAQTSKL